MKRSAQITSQFSVVLTADEFRQALAQPLAVAQRWLAADERLHGRLGDESVRYQGPGQVAKAEAWGRMFPDAAIPDDLAVFRTALVLEWLRRRVEDLFARDPSIKEVVADDNNSCLDLICDDLGHHLHGACVPFYDDSFLAARQLAVAEVAAGLIQVILNEWKNALIASPETVMADFPREKVPTQVTGREMTLDAGLAESLFSLLKLNALDR